MPKSQTYENNGRGSITNTGIQGLVILVDFEKAVANDSCVRFSEGSMRASLSEEECTRLTRRASCIHDELVNHIPP